MKLENSLAVKGASPQERIAACGVDGGDLLALASRIVSRDGRRG